MKAWPGRGIWGTSALLLLLAAAIVFELHPAGRAATSAAQRQRVGGAEIGDGRLPKILAALGALRSRAPESGSDQPRRIPAAAEPVDWETAGARRDGSGVGSEAGEGPRRLSITVSPAALEGLLEQPRQKLEASAEMVLRQGERVLYAGFVGLRLHGGRSRRFGPVRSWRLVFRPTQGAAGLALSLLHWPGDEPLTRLIVHGDQRTDAAGDLWRMTNPIALEVAQRLGAAVPQTAPARLEINGRDHGLVFLTEPIDLAYLRRHRGHDRFVLVRSKRDRRESRWRAGTVLHWRLAQKWWRRQPDRSYDEIRARYDLASLEAWFLASLTCGTTDAYQGALVRDESAPLGRWSWIAWDMDQSFMAARQPMTEPWQEDVWAHLLRRPRDDFRNPILRTLIRNSPQYRQRLAERLRWALDERLDEAFRDALLGRYREIAEHYQVADDESLDRIEEFLERRPAVLRARVAERLPRGDLGGALPPSPTPR
ncbi:MAG: CotH kinase family protein [Acidobacteriota bacterium]